MFILLRASSISKSLRSLACSRIRASLVIRSLKKKIIQQKSISEVHNSYQSVTLTTINNFHGTTSSKFRVAQIRVAVNGAITIIISAKSNLTIILTIST
jgi:hypothetical protein